MPEWYEKSFGSDYMVVYRHRDRENAEREVRNMAGWLALPPGAEVLDVGCGMGRHALSLADLGYRVTGLDLSETLLAEARAKDEGGRVEWVRGDMRRLPFADGRFDVTVNLFTSFGYFTDERDNCAVLRELRRVLRPAGQFLIDYLNPVFVERNLVPHSERVDPETGWTIEERRRIEDGFVIKTITIRTEDGERHYEERVRLLGRDWFERALAEAGLELRKIYGGYDGQPYEQATSPRLILIGRAAR